jgi:tetratricopeptide (TPR) repeat protein
MKFEVIPLYSLKNNLFNQDFTLDEYVYLANLRFNSGQYSDAVNDCEKAIEQNIISLEIYLINYKSYLKLGDFKKAINNLFDAMEYDKLKNKNKNKTYKIFKQTFPYLDYDERILYEQEVESRKFTMKKI